MAKVIAIVNQKGGVTKTTTTVNLGVGLANKGYRVLLVDSDAQGSLTQSLNFGEPDQIEITLPVLLSKIAQGEEFEKTAGVLHHEEGVDLIPCNIDLASFEVILTGMMSREYILKRYLERFKDNYDYIIIDCMPSLGLMTINSLTAADSIIIPIQASYLPVKGLEQLIRSIGMVRKNLNTTLKIDGILVSMFDGRTKFSKDILNSLSAAYGHAIKIYDTRIPHSIRAAECPAAGTSIYKHDPNGKVAEAYRNFTEEVLTNE